MAACGLDFGTSNTALALPNGAIVPIDPAATEPTLFRSVIFFPEDTKETLFGGEAIARYLEENAGRFIQSMKTWLPSSTFTRTQINGRTLLLEELIAIFLTRVRGSAQALTEHTLDQVVLGRPARFSKDPTIDAFAEERLRKAAGLAGFSTVRFVIEPIAAALAWEATLDHDELVLVADFGAGTSDLTLMWLGPTRRERADRRADVVASAGVYVGGDRFDAAIMKHLLLPFFGQGSTYEVGFKRVPIPGYVLGRLLSWNEMSLIRERSTRELIEQMLKSSDRKPAIEALHDLVMYNLGYRFFRAIEKAKIELSTAETSRITFDDERIQLDVPISRAQFDGFSAPLLDELEACADEVMAAAPSNHRVDSVFLTGGSSQIPCVRELFARKFGADRLRTKDAFTSVAEGLGRAAGSTFG